jgi:Transglutaminase-like superfamily/Domain of unknown function (DUF4129)
MSRPEMRSPAVFRRPEQGWSSLLLLLAMLVLVGVSVGDARLPLIDGNEVGRSFIVVMLAGGLIGFVLARSSLGVVRAHLISAAIGATLLLLVAAAAVSDRGDVLPASWEAFTASMASLSARVQADLDPAAAAGTIPAVVSYLLLGAICWTTAQFSAFSIFRYGRSGPAVLAIGIVLFLNLYLASLYPDSGFLPALPQLVLFSSLAMLSLMRLQLSQQRYRWVRRHIADTGEVSRLFLRTGTAFVMLTVVGASSLTLAASTGPHDISFDEFDGVFDGFSDELSRLGEWIGVPGGSGMPRDLDDSFTIQEKWTPGKGIAFTAVVDEGAPGGYWWLQALDEFNGWKWRMADERSTSIGSAFDVFDLTPGKWAEPWELWTATIEVQDLPWKRTVVSSADAYSVSEPVRLTLIDGNDSVGEIEFLDGSTAVEGYEVSSAIRDYSDGPDRLTASQLRSAGTDYPRWVRERYLQVDSAATGTLTKETAASIEKLKVDPYDSAIAIQNKLRGWEYDTDMEGTCDGLNVPECVLTFHRGYCEYYASTMAMVLRELDIPSRMVRGFLPGEPQGDGSWVVPNEAFHAWVEVFFPDYGWIRFDPTPGEALESFGSEETGFAPGTSESTPRPSRTPRPRPTPEQTSLDPSASPEIVVGPTDSGHGDDGALSALLVGGGMGGLLLVGATVLLFFRLRRLPMGDGGTAYGGIVRLATRLGYGPHPAQTEYEFAATLSETLPAVREDLYVVTSARVEAAYGKRRLDDAGRMALRQAYRRIRSALLRISLGRRRRS